MHSEKFNRSLDELDTDLIVTTLYEDERPPKGISGLIDWRLHGFLSRMILNGSIRGQFNESILIPLDKKFPARRLLVLGLGKPKDFNLFKAQNLGTKLGKLLSNLKTHDVAISFPNASDERLKGETERSVLNQLEKSKLPQGFSLRWLDSSVLEN